MRDPIYGFIQVSTSERRLVDSQPFQRLRHIQQLALSNLVYPGATHKRFEHSLGVMHLAGLVFDTVVEHLSGEVKERLPETHEGLEYWRRILRAAALLHDIGHTPFSHAAEKQLLPDGKTHEALTIMLLQDEELRSILEDTPFRAKIEHVIKLAVGKKDAPPDVNFSEWETILAEIITGSSFGVDRMDYLMRDSYHAGVAYGSLDYQRLTQCLRILPYPEQGQAPEEAKLKLGVTHGGIFSAEALVMARHWMFSQVYFHRVRVLYDHYLSEFLMAMLGQGGYPFSCAGHLRLADSEVTVAMRTAALDADADGHKWAKRIVERKHHKLLASFTSEEALRRFTDIEEGIAVLKRELGNDGILREKRNKEAAVDPFPVEGEDGRIYTSADLSNALANAPIAFADYLFVEATVEEKAKKIWKEFKMKAEKESK